MSLTFGSLFAGIGGFDLGLERAGMVCRWQVEKDEFCREVLANHWRDTPRFGAIEEVQASELEWVDVICGGFPCQPVSLAGRRNAQADERWLWQEFARIVRDLRPRYVLVENVPGLLSPVRRRGEPTIPAPVGEVLGDLSACGYDAEWTVLSASAFGAPHLRERIFLVAYAGGSGCGQGQLEPQPRIEQGAPFAQTPAPDPARLGCEGVAGGQAASQPGAPAPDPDRQRQQQPGRAIGEERRRIGDSVEAFGDTQGVGCRTRREEIFAKTRLGESPSVRTDWWTDVDAGVRGVVHGVPRRMDGTKGRRIRALGNAVVPQVAEFVGRLLVEFDRTERIDS